MSKEEIKEQWVKIRTMLLSGMLDNPDKVGIYPTTKFYEGIDHYFECLSDEYATQEAIGFAEWVDSKSIFRNKGGEWVNADELKWLTSDQLYTLYQQSKQAKP